MDKLVLIFIGFSLSDNDRLGENFSNSIFVENVFFYFCLNTILCRLKYKQLEKMYLDF